MPLRHATPADLPALRGLINAAVRGLSAGYYTTEQVESALRHVLGPDSQLIADRTYYVIEEAGDLVAAGGWGLRRTTHGGDHAEGTDNSPLDPAIDPARVRAFFVHPMWARRGLARQIYERCATDARSAGFRSFELVATLPGEPLYLALGFTAHERTAERLPDGQEIAVVRMTRALDA